MARPRKGGVRVDIRRGLALLDHTLEPEQVAINTLAVRRPRRILQMARHRLTE